MIMTREEQIKEYLKKRNIPMDSLEADSIIEGINWADKTMIDNASEWLQINAYKYIRAIGSCMYFDVINSANDFKRAMEE